MKFKENKKIILLSVIVFILILINGYLLVDFQNNKIIPVSNTDVFNYEKIKQENDFYNLNAKIMNSETFTSCAVNSFIKNRIVEFQKLASKQVPELKEEGFQGKYSLDISVQDYQTEEYISYLLKIGEYTGGANANQVVNTFVFDKKEQKQLSLEEAVEKDSFMLELKNKLKNKEEDLFLGIVEEITFEDINAFYIDKDSIVVLFSKYQIAPGAAGVVEVSLNKKNIIKNKK
jgi:hypothetical protein